MSPKPMTSKQQPSRQPEKPNETGDRCHGLRFLAFRPRRRQYVNQVLDYGMHNTRSAGMVARLEREFAERFGQRYAIAHANGTVSMHTALMAADVGVGDEVIVPAYTVYSTASVVLNAGAVPIFADVDPRTWTIDPADVRRKISPRTRAIIPVSIGGLAPDYHPLVEICRQHRLTLIEDNAQCFLGYYKGKIVGSIGDFASFSFQGSKHMTCGDGGILICSDPELATRARKAATLGYATLTARPGDVAVPKELRCHPEFQRHNAYGFNYRLPEMAAALALGELERLDELVEMRLEVTRRLQQASAGCTWLVPQWTPPDFVHSWWTYTVRLDRADIVWTDFRRKFVELGGDGFYAAYLPVYREPFFPGLSRMVREQPAHYPQWADLLPDYAQVICPVWEKIQPRIIQFKTNYIDLDSADRQAQALARTIDHFESAGA